MEKFISIAAHVTCSSILVALGLSCIILIAGSHATMDQYVDGGTLYPQDSNSIRGSLLKYIPGHLVTAGNNSVFAAGIFSVVAGFFGFVLLCLNNFIMAVTGIIITFSSMFTALFAVIYSMVSYYTNDKTWGYYDVLSTNGTYTIEAWTCALKEELHHEEKEFSKVCLESVSSEIPPTQLRRLRRLTLCADFVLGRFQNTARFLTVPLLVINISFLIVVVLQAWENYLQRNAKKRKAKKVPKASA